MNALRSLFLKEDMVIGMSLAVLHFVTVLKNFDITVKIWFKIWLNQLTTKSGPKKPWNSYLHILKWRKSAVPEVKMPEVAT